MTNKYLEKVAYYVYVTDPYADARASREYEVDEANQSLFSRGFEPEIQYHQYHKADALNNRVFEAEKRPLEVSANRWSALGGLGTAAGGGIAGAILARKYLGYNAEPFGAGVGAIAGGIGGFMGLKKMIYSNGDRKKDDAVVKTKENALLEYLAKNYKKHNE